jgi:hypothetical protein
MLKAAREHGLGHLLPGVLVFSLVFSSDVSE